MTRALEPYRQHTRDARKTALVLAEEMAEFHLPKHHRHDITEKLFRAITSELPLAEIRSECTGRDRVLKLAKDSLDVIVRCLREFTALTWGVARAGVEVYGSPAHTDRVRTTHQVVTDLVPYMPSEYYRPITSMPLEELATASPTNVRAYYVDAIEQAAWGTAALEVERLEALFEMIVAGFVEFLNGGAARIIHCRGSVKSIPGRLLPRYPTQLASHPFFENPYCLVARVSELLDVRQADIGRWTGMPERVRAMLDAVPRWLKPEVKRFTGRRVRDGRGGIDLIDKRRWSYDEVAFGEFSFVVLADHFVLASWDHAEGRSLLAQLFGIRR